MKKILALLLALMFIFSLVACNGTETKETENGSETETEAENKVDPNAKSEDVMSYAEYAAAAIESKVVVEAFVQAKQSWWEKDGVGVATIYAQDGEGGYFFYEMPVSKEDYDKRVNGTKIKVTGYEAEWSGEVEIIDATYEFAGTDTYVAEAKDITDKLGTEELVNYQNQLLLFKGMTVVSIAYKDSEWDKDIYLTVSYNGTNYDFCVENYLCGPDTDVYKAVQGLAEGDVIDVVGFAYWYEGINTHITGVTKK